MEWLSDSLNGAVQRHDFALWGYVFMPEHVHLLVKPRAETYSISRFLYSVKESVAPKAVLYKAKSNRPESTWERFYDFDPDGSRHFRFWQRGGGYDRNVFSDEEL